MSRTEATTEFDGLDYVARCPECKRLVGWCHATLERNEIAEWVGDCIKAGLSMGRMTTEQAKAAPWRHTRECSMGRAALAAFRGDARREEPTDDDVAAIKAENDRYRDIYGCLSCDESHPRGVMCPPHEVRSSEPWWRKKLSALAAQRDAAQAEVDRLTKERDEARNALTEAGVPAEATISGGIKFLAEQVAEYEEGFTLRGKVQQRAIKRWQAATGKNMTWAYHEDLCVWLMERLESAESEAARLRESAALAVKERDEARQQKDKAIAFLNDAWPKLHKALDEAAVPRPWQEANGCEYLVKRIKELAARGQSAPRPLPPGWRWDRIREDITRQVLSPGTARAALKDLLKWAESQPGAATEAEPALAETVAKLEARVAALEAREATLLKQEEIRCAHSTWRSGVGNSKWMA